MEDMNLTNSNVNSENSVEMAPVTPAAPVVGFQAVDAEGNVVGFISKADLVNEAKQALYADLAFMEQNRPMTLPANTEQLAATAAAATDVYEDQLAIKSDAPYIRGLDAAGNPIRISKADLATVVGGLLPIANLTQSGLMSSNVLKYSTAYVIDASKKFKIAKRSAYVESVFEIIGRSTFEEFVHLIVKHYNKNVTIVKGVYNNAPDERNEYKFYMDDASFYIITPSANSCSIRVLGATSNNHISYEVMSDTSITGLTPLSIN